MKIFDCFLFYNELDLLELRFSEHYDYVDYFVIVEATATFQGNAKKLFFKENIEKFSKYLNKVIHVIVEDGSPSTNAWENEFFQRNAIIRGLSNASENDICIIGDVDEILRPETLQKLRQEESRQVVAMRMPYFNFKFNYMLTNSKEKYCVWSIACKKNCLTSPQAIRSMRKNLSKLPFNYKDNEKVIYEHAGWHFTYMGDDQWIRNKLKSFAHTELNTPKVLDEINVSGLIQQGLGFHPKRKRKFQIIRLNEYLPNTIVNNQAKYKSNLLQGGIKSAAEFLPSQSSNWQKIKFFFHL